jgi:hypothetical protein
LNIYCLRNSKFCIIFVVQIDYGHTIQPDFAGSTGNWSFLFDEEDVKGNVTSCTPSLDAVTTSTTDISTTVKGSIEIATADLTTNITVTDSDITNTTAISVTVKETVDNATSDLTTNITITDSDVTNTTAISVTDKETVDNATADLTTNITITDSDITNTHENVTSSTPSTSTTEEETPPAA